MCEPWNWSEICHGHSCGSALFPPTILVIGVAAQATSENKVNNFRTSLFMKIVRNNEEY